LGGYVSAWWIVRIAGRARNVCDHFFPISREDVMSQINSGQTRSGTSRRGFASMDQQRQREIASKGGRAAHAQGRAHEFSADEARAAGRKGGQEVSRNRTHMSEIGRKGGAASRGGRGRTVASDGGIGAQGRSQRIEPSAPTSVGQTVGQDANRSRPQDFEMGM
jgi:uncharacterized protein